MAASWLGQGAPARTLRGALATLTLCLLAPAAAHASGNTITGLHASATADASEIRFGGAWLSADGGSVRADIRLGLSDITVNSLDEADALLAAATELKAEMTRLEAERKAAEGGEPQ